MQHVVSLQELHFIACDAQSAVYASANIAHSATTVSTPQLFSLLLTDIIVNPYIMHFGWYLSWAEHCGQSLPLDLAGA